VAKDTHMHTPTTVEVMLGDPLSEVTRRERRMLLGVSVLSIFIAKTGLVPEKISALGVELAKTDQKAFLGIMVFVVLYFVTAFIVYGLTDFLAWMLSYNLGAKAALQMSIGQVDQKIRGIEEEPIIRAPNSWFYPWLRRLTTPLSLVRAGFEFVLPLVVGGYAVYILMAFRCQI
jgi:hypothetical protein